MSAASHPLTYLRRRELVNTVRLAGRSRRHLVALALFGLVLVLFVGEPFVLVLGGARTTLLGARDAYATARLALAGWFALHTLQWLRAGLSDRVLLLPQAHYDVLFPAPVSRRALVLNHLASSYLPFLWGSPVMALPIFAAAGVWFPEYRPAYFVITVLTFLLFDLVAFNLTTLAAVVARSGGVGRLATRWLLRSWLATLVVLLLGTTAWRLLGGELQPLLATLLRWLLAPCFALADLALAPIAGLPAWGTIALVLLALLSAGSLALLVDRFAQATEPGRDAASSADGPPAGLGWTGGVVAFNGEGALAWKALLAVRRGGGRLVVVIGVGALALVVGAALRSPGLTLAAAPAAFLLYYGLLAEALFGVFVADLERPELLRPLPLRPSLALAASLGSLVGVGILAGWAALAAAWLVADTGLRGWLSLAAAELPLVVPLLFLARGLLLTLFPPQREAETLDLVYAAVVELAALVVGMVTLLLPVLVLAVGLLADLGVLWAWVISLASALPFGGLLWWGLLGANRRRGLGT